MIKKRAYIASIIFFIILIITFIWPTMSEEIIKLEDAKGKMFVNEPEKEKQEMKVLVIHIDPILTSVTNTSLYTSNSGHPKVSEYMGHDANKSVNELKEDLEYASKGFLKISIQNEYLNEFPTYNAELLLKNGTKSYSFDEETYIDVARGSENDKGDWFKLIYSDYVQSIPAYSFNYNYIIEKFDLVNRRNNGEFDQVWLNTIDPSQTFETMMVGSSAYWINGTPIIKNCSNFAIVNVSISRRDSNLHALGHMVENVLNASFGTRYNNYEKDAINISTVEELENLNLWERFTLNDYNSTGDNASVGTIHFSPNGTKDYDYENTSTVQSSWKDWKNYPNLTGNKELTSAKAWLEYPDNLELGEEENKASDRLHTRWWFSLLPSISGYYKDGHFNNWWKYIYSLDYVENIKINGSNQKEFEIGDSITIDCTLNYQSKKTETIQKVKEDNNIQIENNNIIGFDNGVLIAKSNGTTKLTINYDGKSAEYVITVKENEYTTKNLRIPPSTIKSDLEIDVDKLYDSKGNEVYDNQILKTGMLLTSEVNKEKYRIIVIGDVNGDGKVTATDLLKVKRHSVGLETLKDEYALAGDVNDKNGISPTDVLQIKKVISNLLTF